MGAVSGISRLHAALLSAAAVALLAGVTAPPAAAAPARGCGAQLTLEQRAERAADVFTGTVADRTESGSRISYTVSSGQVYKGSVSTEQVTVTTDSRPRSCGLPTLVAGDEYVFFTQERGDELTTGRGTGTARATEAYVARVEALLGSGHPAVAPPPPPAEAVNFDTVASPPAELSRVVAPGVALVLVGMLGMVLAAWRARRRG